MQRKKPKAKMTPPAPMKVDQEAVTRLAYKLYVRRGGEHGHELEDWLMAEKILIEQQKRPAPHRRVSDASRRLEDKFQH